MQNKPYLFGGKQGFPRGGGGGAKKIPKKSHFFGSHPFVNNHHYLINYFRYTCTADNGVGNPVSEDITLKVLCKYFSKFPKPL